MRDYLKKIVRYKKTHKDLHLIRYCSAFIFISGGRIIEMTEPEKDPCRLAKCLYPSLRRQSKEKMKEYKSSVRATIENKIAKYGFFTKRRKTASARPFTPFGSSEMLMRALKEKVIDAAVMACDGAGTVVVFKPETAQGIGGRMNGLFFTTPVPEIVEKLESHGCLVVPDGRIDQREGAGLAMRKGAARIAVVVNASLEENLRGLRGAIEREGRSAVILAVCTNGIREKRIDEIKSNADIVWSCNNSRAVKLWAPAALLQVSLSMPVFALSRTGLDFINAIFKKFPDGGDITPDNQYLMTHCFSSRNIRMDPGNIQICRTHLPVLSHR